MCEKTKTEHKESVEEKREKYYKENPIVYKLYQEVKTLNENPTGGGIQQEQLNEIKAYAIEHTKFYKGYLINDRFPVMTKLDYINNRKLIDSDEKFDHPIHVSSTSGSTGTTFSVKQNYEKRMRNIADLKVFGEYALYPDHEKMIQLRAYNGKKLDRSVDKQENIWRYDISPFEGPDMDRLISFILEWEPHTIFGYASTLERFSDYILKKNQSFDFHCTSVLVGADMLTDECAAKISTVFNCPIFDRYSNMEMGIYAQREYGKTNFKINTGSYYLEVLKLDKDEPASEHEIGRIVFTDLYNHAFPMIRYDTGDLGAYCLKNGGMEIETIYGRKMDSIYSADGRLVNPHELTRILKEFPEIAQWQFIQMDEKNYLLKLIPASVINEVDICYRLYDVLGKGANIRIEYDDKIPVLNSQKRKMIINEWRIK